MKALLNYGKTGLVIVKPTFGGEQIEIQARLSFRKDDNDQLQLVPHFVRNEPKLDVAYKGYTFTPEDKKNLLQNGNLGKVVDFPDKNTGAHTRYHRQDTYYQGRQESALLRYSASQGD